MSLQDETETCNISKLRGIAVAPKGPGGGGGGATVLRVTTFGRGKVVNQEEEDDKNKTLGGNLKVCCSCFCVCWFKVLKLTEIENTSED